MFAVFCAASATTANEPEKIEGVKLNKDALEYAKKLVLEGHVVVDSHGAWRKDRPSPEKQNEFIRLHGFEEYVKWHLGIDERHAENSKARYKFPYGDFKNVHRCAVLAVQSRAGQYKHYDIEEAAIELREMIEAKPEYRQAPNPNIQAPRCLERQRALGFGSWSFFGCWSLEFPQPSAQAVRNPSISSGRSSL